MPAEMDFKGAMAKAKASIVFATRPNATSMEAKMVAAASHYLESWNDANPVTGHYAVTQPTINPLFDTKQLQECLMSWTRAEGSYYDYIREYWDLSEAGSNANPIMRDDLWNKTLEAGYLTMEVEDAEAGATFTDNASTAISAIGKTKSSELEIEFYSKVGIGNGSQSHNPW